jgi:PAS domain S-box-containing protein
VTSENAVSDELLKESLVELYEDAPCGYLFTDPDGRILRVNRTLLEWTGRARGEVLGRRFQDLLTVPGRLFYENQYAPLLRMQGFVNGVALEMVRAEGEPLAALVNSVLRADGAGRPRFVASTVFDATGRRSYERELLRARRAA